MAGSMADGMADSTCQGTALPLQDNALHKRARLFRRTRDALASCTRRKLRLLRLSPLQANRASRSRFDWQPASKQPPQQRRVCAQGRLQA